MERFTGLLGLVVDPGGRLSGFHEPASAIQPRVLLWGLGLQFGFASWF